MHAIEVETTFRATHALRLEGGGREPAHEHAFRVTARLAARQLDGSETVLDFHVVEALLEAIVGPWRGRSLNEIAPFAERVNPSAERLAEEIGRRLSATVSGLGNRVERGVRVVEVRVTEAAGCVGIWWAEQV